MFESLLEKILQTQFGKYLEGLDRENLRIGVRRCLIYLNGGLEREYCSWKRSIKEKCTHSTSASFSFKNGKNKAFTSTIL